MSAERYWKAKREGMLMQLAEVFCSAVFNIFSVYINFRVILLFLPQKEKPDFVKRSIYFAVWAINFGIYYGFHNSVLTTGSLLAGILVAAIVLYEGNLLQKSVATVASVALGLILEDFVWRILEDSTIGNDAALGSLLSSVVFMIVVLVLERFVRLDKTEANSLGSQLNIIIILLGSVVVGEVLVKCGESNPNWTMIGISVLCLMNISTFYLYEKVNEAYLERVEKEMAKQHLAMYENQINLLNQSQKRIRALQHDIKNHMLLIRAYLEQGEYRNAISYIQSAMEFVENPMQYVNSGNTEVDSILNYMLERAAKLSCQVETQIEIPDSRFMPEFDLNVLLSNLLSNALEALEKTEDRYLFVGLKYERGMFLVRIYNTYAGGLLRKENHFLTRKQDRERHGIGLQNVDEIVKKYDGELNRKITDSQFKTDIVLYVKTALQ
jgi:tetratricopeptide (TPR) repeat protein